MAKSWLSKVKGYTLYNFLILADFLKISHFKISKFFFAQEYSIEMEDTDDDVMAVTDSEEDLHPSEIRKRCMFLHNTKLTARLSTFSFYCKSLSTIQHRTN